MKFVIVNLMMICCIDAALWYTSTIANDFIQIISSENHSFNLKSSIITDILENDHFRDRQLVVVSIGGPIQQDKSLFLNFCLKYLYARVIVCKIKLEFSFEHEMLSK